VNGIIAQAGRCLIIDCHSFPSAALPYETDQSKTRADICIGTDPFHTPPFIRDAVAAGAKAMDFSVAIDAPFSGALVPISYYRKDRRVLSVMIEVNRRLYMEKRFMRDKSKELDFMDKYAASERGEMSPGPPIVLVSYPCHRSRYL